MEEPSWNTAVSYSGLIWKFLVLLRSLPVLSDTGKRACISPQTALFSEHRSVPKLPFSLNCGRALLVHGKKSHQPSDGKQHQIQS